MKASRAAESGGKRSTVGAVWCVCLAATLIASAACAQPSVRVIERDTNAGGPSGVALNEMTPYFDDPALADALADLDGDRGAPAVRAFAAWLEEHPDDERHDLAVFIHAWALFVNHRWEDAVPALEACATALPDLSDYCMYGAASASAELERWEIAEVYAATVRPDSVYGPRAQWLRGQALMELGRLDEAVSTLESFLAAWPGAWYRDDVEFDLARAYAERGDMDDAARVYHRIALLHPGESAETRAQDALDDLLDELSDGVRRDVTNRSAAETLERAQVLFDRHRSEQVIDLLDGVVEDEDAPLEVRCQASYLVAKSYTKLRQHTNAVPWYEFVYDGACDDEDLIVWSLYNGARGLWNIDRDDDAYAVFERLWTGHAAHSYADDAMLYGARILRASERNDEYLALLDEQVQRFPDGDMLKDAVWLRVAERYMAGDFTGTVALVDELGSRTGENDLYSRGRVAYFRGRSLEQLSLTSEARAAYADVMRTYPMSFYSLLSLNRLLVLDEPMARALVDELRADAPQTEGFIEVRPEALRRDPAFVRGVLFLRLGQFELAEGEFRALQARYANEDEVGWVLSLLYHRAGAYTISHHVPGERLDLNLWYPSGSNRERWEIAYPRPFWDLVSEYAGERELEPYLVYAIMREESGFEPTIESWANARGLLQLMEGTANDMAALTGRGSVRASELFDAETNIELGTMFMRTLADRFEAHPSLVIAGYNGGAGNVRSWLRDRGDLAFDMWVEEIPYSQTRHYVKRVTMSYWIYRWLYGDGDPWVVLPYDLSEILSSAP